MKNKLKQPRFKEARLKKGLTQKEAAKIIGISERYYRAMENHEFEVRLRLFIRFCKNLDVSARYVLRESDEFGKYDLESRK